MMATLLSRTPRPERRVKPAPPVWSHHGWATPAIRPTKPANLRVVDRTTLLSRGTIRPAAGQGCRRGIRPAPEPDGGSARRGSEAARRRRQRLRAGEVVWYEPADHHAGQGCRRARRWHLAPVTTPAAVTCMAIYLATRSDFPWARLSGRAATTPVDLGPPE
jgi:hypothetical protein